MKNSIFKKILIFEPVIVLILAAATYFIFINIKSKNETVAELNRTISREQELQTYTSSVEKYIQNNQEGISKIDSYILGKEADVDFIENLESLAKENNLEIEIDSLGFKDDPAIKNPSLTTFNVRAELSGKWQGTYNFLNQLESMPVKLRVVNFSSTISSNRPSEFSSTTSANPYWQSRFEIEVLKYK